MSGEWAYRDDWLSLWSGDFRDCEIADESVDLVFTDPPYPREYIPLNGSIVGESARILKPGGSVIAYCGHFALPDVMAEMAAHLRYYWILKCDHPGSMAWLTAYRIKASWKPVLWFKKPPAFPPANTVNVVDRLQSPMSKRHDHPWEQGVEGVELIAALASGGVVYDPFAGTGTTMVAAKLAGARSAIACELEAKYINTIRGRAAQEVLFT